MRVGGGHLYATVVNYLHTEVAPRLFGGDGRREGAAVFNGAAALTEMAGWMAHDAGRDQGARQHFDRALGLAQVGGDHQLAAHILGSMSHLAHQLEQPEKAVEYAYHGRETLRQSTPHPAMEARLLALQARGLATLRKPDEWTQLIIEAEQSLASAPIASPSPWISNFDGGSLASEAARCMADICDFTEAQRQAERVIALRPCGRTRSRAFGQLTLVTVLIGQGRPDEACAVAQEVLDATHSLGSYRVIQQLLDLRRLLASHRSNRIVTDFLGCLDHTLQERRGLYTWLSKDGHSGRSVEDV